VRAEDPGLDLVVLVDESGSMSGAGTPAASDPDGHRHRMVVLTADLLAQSADLDRLSHRLAVVSFGTEARIDLPFTPCGGETLPGLRRAVAALGSRGSLGHTDFRPAFEAAGRLFAQLPRAPERRRAVLLITDGAPSLPGASTGRHREDLERLVAGLGSGSEVAIEVIGLSPADRWARSQDLWRSLARSAWWSPGEADQALAAAHQVVSGLVATQVAKAQPAVTGGVEESLILPPYLETAVFDVFGAQAAAGVVIVPPASPDRPVPASLEATAPEVEESWLGDVVRTVTVHRPAPGRWIFRKPSRRARVEIFSRQFYPRGELVEPQPGKEIYPGQAVEIGYRLLDGSRGPLVPLPGYPLEVQLALVRPDGGRRHYEMAKSQRTDSRSTYESKSEVRADLPGHYRTEVELAATTASGDRVTVFRDLWSGFEVREPELIACQASMPRSVVRAALRSAPPSLRLECRNRRGEPFDFEDLGGEAAADLFRPRLSRGQMPLPAALNLRPAGRGVVEGPLVAALGPGEFSLKLEVDHEQILPKHRLTVGPPVLHFAGRIAGPTLARAGIGALLLLLGLGVVGCARAWGGPRAAPRARWTRRAPWRQAHAPGSRGR
jgi:hypothetical protein